MMDNLIVSFFAFIGFGCSFGIGYYLIVTAYSIIKEKLEEKRRQEEEEIVGKKPTARCYCKQCQYFNKTEKACRRKNEINEDFFCKGACYSLKTMMHNEEEA